MQNFQDLDMWRRSHALVLQIYRITEDLPQTETFGLTLNLRRSAISMATRIAEGAGKPSDGEFAIELKRARAIGYEFEYLLLVARDLNLLKEPAHKELAGEIIEVRRMLSGLIKRLTSAP